MALAREGNFLKKGTSRKKLAYPRRNVARLNPTDRELLMWAPSVNFVLLEALAMGRPQYLPRRAP
jgi:hypothetical protein